MQSAAPTPTAYYESLPEDRKEPMRLLRETILSNLPKGFEESMGWGMVNFVVPHRLYPAGYHCDPKQPLPFIAIASQKNFIALYHMGIYAQPDLLNWFTASYAAQVPGKLDMGKSCIRFKKPAQIPYALIGELCTKMSPEEWIEVYESAFRRK
jgi:hypothetical protein